MAIAVITFNDIPSVNETFKYERLGQMALENRRIYCGRHGYHFVGEVPIARDRPACWAKIPAILAAFRSHDWVLWADSDTLIFDQARRLEDFCDPGHDLVVQSHADYFQRMGIPLEQGLARMPINTGIFLMRATDWSRAFLQAAYDQTRFISAGEIWNGIGEQEAMIWLIQQQSSHRQHIQYVDHLQNHPKLYMPGDFAVHFYGNNAPHLLTAADCEEVFQRWEAANRAASTYPSDLARFHWCCIQNIQAQAKRVRGDLAHYLYCPADVGLNNITG